jgi:hypothetical protein
MRTPQVGRYAYGLASVFFAALLFWNPGHHPWHILAAAAALAGGILVQFQRWAKGGAIVLGILYGVFALLTIPGIVHAPRVYVSWGNFFEQLSYVPGALVIYASLAASLVSRRLRFIGRVVFGICVVSFALEQALYLQQTASLVPAWMPSSPAFWAAATTIAFALAAIALLSGVQAQLAARLLTAMLVVFGVAIWIPAVVTAPHDYFNWSENVENLTVAAVAWIVAESQGT